MAKLPTRKKLFDLVGESYDNHDGCNRQDELLQCDPGEAVELTREPDNPYDANAVLVRSCRGIGIGYLNRADAAAIAPAIDEGRSYEATLHELRGGVSGYTTYGARICIAWDGAETKQCVPLDEDQLRSRRGKLAMKGRDRDSEGRLVGSTASSEKAGGGCAGVLAMVSLVPLALVLLR